MCQCCMQNRILLLVCCCPGGRLQGAGKPAANHSVQFDSNRIQALSLRDAGTHQLRLPYTSCAVAGTFRGTNQNENQNCVVWWCVCTYSRQAHGSQIPPPQITIVKSQNRGGIIKRVFKSDVGLLASLLKINHNVFFWSQMLPILARCP